MKLFLLLLVAIIPIFSDPIATIPSKGDGTLENPYQIASLENLYWMTTDTTLLSKYFIQIADINASDTRNWFNTVGWTPLGYSKPFSGSYDGQGFTIDSLYMNRGLFSQQNANLSIYDGYFVGFISQTIAPAYIQNIHLTNVEIHGNQNVGGIVSKMKETTIENCSVNGLIDGGKYTGGIVGQGSGKIKNSSSSGIVDGGDYTGGIVGTFEHSNTFSIIENCHSTANIDGNNYTGGIAGMAVDTLCHSTSKGTIDGSEDVGGIVGFGSKLSIFQCGNHGIVQGRKDVGGIVGGSSKCIISESYNLTQIRGSSDYIGGIVGYALTGATVINCYNRGDVKGHQYVAGILGWGGTFENVYSTGIIVVPTVGNAKGDIVAWGTGSDTKSFKTTAGMDSSGILNSWDFATIWNIDANVNDGFPTLRW